MKVRLPPFHTSLLLGGKSNNSETEKKDTEVLGSWDKELPDSCKVAEGGRKTLKMGTTQEAGEKTLDLG